MPNRFSNSLSGLQLLLGSRNPRWRAHFGRYLPLLKDTFQGNNTARLLVFRFLDAVEAKELARAKTFLERLRIIANAGGAPPEMALYLVLAGVYHLQRSDIYEAARFFRLADKHGHNFHLPRMILGIHYIYDRWMFDRAYEELDKGIDCVYAWGPMDEQKRRGIAAMHSLMSLSMTMMHRTDEAERLIRLGEPGADTPEYQHALATLRAVQGRRAEAEAALENLKKTEPIRYEHWQEGIRMMLEGTHPHFTPREPDAQAISDYWAWFAENEKELRRILTQTGPQACHAAQREAFGPLVPEPARIDMMSHSLVLVEGRPEIHFSSLYSRNYAVLIDALIAACPLEVAGKWRLRSFTGSPRGSASETVAYYAQQEGQEHAVKEED